MSDIYNPTVVKITSTGGTIVVTPATGIGIVNIETSGGGGGPPGGSNTDVQFNDSGSFGGSNKFTFNKTNGQTVIDATGSSPFVDAQFVVHTNKVNDDGIVVTNNLGPGRIEVLDSIGMDISLRANNDGSVSVVTDDASTYLSLNTTNGQPITLRPHDIEVFNAIETGVLTRVPFGWASSSGVYPQIVTENIGSNTLEWYGKDETTGTPIINRFDWDFSTAGQVNFQTGTGSDLAWNWSGLPVSSDSSITADIFKSTAASGQIILNSAGTSTTLSSGSPSGGITVTLPSVTGTIATLANTSQTFLGATTFSNSTIHSGASTFTSITQTIFTNGIAVNVLGDKFSQFGPTPTLQAPSNITNQLVVSGSIATTGTLLTPFLVVSEYTGSSSNSSAINGFNAMVGTATGSIGALTAAANGGSVRNRNVVQINGTGAVTQSSASSSRTNINASGGSIADAVSFNSEGYVAVTGTTLTSFTDFRARSLASTVSAGTHIGFKADSALVGTTIYHFASDGTGAGTGYYCNTPTRAGLEGINSSSTGVLNLFAGTSINSNILQILAASTTASASMRITAGTAPTSPVEGDMWADSTQKAAIRFVDGIKQAQVGATFTQTADQTVTNTVTETTIIGTGVGTLTLPANFFVAGKVIRLRIGGIYSTPSLATPSVTIKVKYGSTVVATVTTSSLFSGASGLEFDGEVLITCRTTGSSGTIVCHGDIEYATGVAGTISVDALNNGGATTTINTTTSNAIDVTLTWDTATSTRIAKSTSCTVEVLN